MADRHHTQRIAEASMVVALSIALGNLRLLELPAGGSISGALLPLLAFAALRGVRAGACAGLVAGFGHVVWGGTVLHPIQLLLDYGVAYAAAGLAGIASVRRSRAMLAVGIVLAESVQLGAFVVSGTIFFGAGGTTQAAALFALGYNALTVVPETALALLLVPALVRACEQAGLVEAVRQVPAGHTRLPPPKAHYSPPRTPAPQSSTLAAARLLPPPLGRTNRAAAALDTPTDLAARSCTRPVRRAVASAERPALRREPLFTATSSGTSPSAWRTRPPRRDFAR